MAMNEDLEAILSSERWTLCGFTRVNQTRRVDAEGASLRGTLRNLVFPLQTEGAEGRPAAARKHSAETTRTHT